MDLLKGIIPVLPATFNEDGTEVDYDSLGRVVDTVIEEGVHGIALFGIGTEFYKLSDRERERMLTVVVEKNRGRVPVVSSVTRNSTELAVEEAKYAEAAGADAIMVFPPHFITPSKEGLIKHILSVADSVNLPLIIQYTPQYSGFTIPAETFLDIMEKSGREIYVKAEAIPPGPMVTALIEGSKGKLGVFTGNGGIQAYDAMERGAIGFMPGCAMAKLYVQFYNEYVDGSKEKAFEICSSYTPLVLSIVQSAEIFLKFEKMILAQRGIIKSDYCRLPNYIPDTYSLNEFQKHYDTLKRKYDCGRTY